MNTSGQFVIGSFTNNSRSGKFFLNSNTRSKYSPKFAVHAKEIKKGQQQEGNWNKSKQLELRLAFCPDSYEQFQNII